MSQHTAPRPSDATAGRVQLHLWQFEPTHGDPESNLQRLSDALETQSMGEDGTSLVVLPELALSGYLFDHTARPFLKEKFMPGIKSDVIGAGLSVNDNSVDNRQLVEVNAAIRDHSVEVVGRKLRGYMTGMKSIV